MIEVMFERHNRARDIASTLRYMKKECMFGNGMIRCRMEGKSRVYTTWETFDDARSSHERLARVFMIGTYMSLYEQVQSYEGGEE